MKKQLNKMNNRELGELFPIIIADPNPSWPEIFEDEKKFTEIKIKAESF